MLVDHADAVRDRVVRAGEAHLAAVDVHGTRVGRVEAVQHAHQGRLAGPVLADDAVHRRARHRQVDAVVGPHGAETLVDAAQLDGERRAAVRSVQ